MTRAHTQQVLGSFTASVAESGRIREFEAVLSPPDLTRVGRTSPSRCAAAPTPARAAARSATQHLDEDPPRAPLRRAPELPQHHCCRLDSRLFLHMTRIV